MNIYPQNLHHPAIAWRYTALKTHISSHFPTDHVFIPKPTTPKLPETSHLTARKICSSTNSNPASLVVVKVGLKQRRSVKLRGSLTVFKPANGNTPLYSPWHWGPNRRMMDKLLACL